MPQLNITTSVIAQIQPRLGWYTLRAETKNSSYFVISRPSGRGKKVVAVIINETTGEPMRGTHIGLNVDGGGPLVLWKDEKILFCSTKTTKISILEN